MIAPKGILTDTTLCIGCEKCVEACRKEYKLGKDVPRRWKIRIDDLSSTRYTTLVRKQGNRFVRKQCRHCLDPACVSACIVRAMTKMDAGPVVYDGDKCMGCRYCMMACPYAIPRYDWEKPIPYVRKCTMCFERVKQGKTTACVEACPEKATIFGSRDELLREAHRRIQAKPGKYMNKVFGETEVGGTSVLYISDMDLGFLACKPNLEETTLPDLTWAALSKVPWMVLGVGGLMGAVWWITDRRAKVAAESAQTSAPVEADAPPPEEQQSPDQPDKDGEEKT